MQPPLVCRRTVIVLMTFGDLEGLLQRPSFSRLYTLWHCICSRSLKVIQGQNWKRRKLY